MEESVWISSQVSSVVTASSLMDKLHIFRSTCSKILRSSSMLIWESVS